MQSQGKSIFGLRTRFLQESISLKLIAYTLITLVAIYSYNFIPPKVKALFPIKNASTSLFSNSTENGAMAVWIDQSQAQWVCNVPENNTSSACGFNLSLDIKNNFHGLNVADFDQLKMKIDYRGPNQRIRIFTRSYLKNFSKLNDWLTYQFSDVLMPVSYLQEELNIDLKEFFVAEWWIQDYKVPRELMRTDLSDTVLLGFDLNYPMMPGKHEFKVIKMELIGKWISKENWYFSIMLFWIVAIFTNGAYKLWSLNHKYVQERHQLNLLMRENSDLANESDKYKKMSMEDELTKLHNRHGITQYIQKYYTGVDAKNVSLIIIDIDFFKLVNDTYGHANGDIVLQQLANLISENLRTTDKAARWGGEEFIIVLPATSLLEAKIVSEKMRSLTEKLVIAESPEIKLTISLGVGNAQEGEPFHLLFRRVDAALYRAKKGGRNRVEVSKP